jgi:uncharacterized protein YlzI (FlbEa/FlbD family)
MKALADGTVNGHFRLNTEQLEAITAARSSPSGRIKPHPSLVLKLPKIRCLPDTTILSSDS